MTCITLRKIKPEEEIVALYDRHYFGNFNIDCCCSHKNYHNNPCPESPDKKNRKRNKTSAQSVTKTIKSKSKRTERQTSFFLTNQDISSRFSKTEQDLEESSDENDDTPIRPIFYDSLYSDNTPDKIVGPRSPLLDDSTANQLSTDFIGQVENWENNLLTEEVDISSDDVLDFLPSSPPLFESTPLNLSIFEEVDEINIEHDEASDDSDELDTSSSFEVFSGSSLSVSRFYDSFNLLSSRHKLSEEAKKDILKLLSFSLPSPNNLSVLTPNSLLPNIVITEKDSSCFLIIDLRLQLESIIEQNFELIKISWSGTCSWSASTDCFKYGELQIVLNIDGASVFKSRNIAIWPLWVQLYNLPPKVRYAVNNMCLLALWHGFGKPDFEEFLPLIFSDLQLTLKRNLTVQNLGKISIRVRCLVADMPATAYSLCMTQHMGYFSCAFCFMRGVHHKNLLLFPVKAPLTMRTKESFIWCGRKAEQKQKPVLGVKRFSPFNAILDFPWDAPIDPMHQVFLGTAKVLSKFMILLVFKAKFSLMQHRMSMCMVPFNILHRPKNLDEIKFWKAADFKLFFFHIAPLTITTDLIPTANQSQLLGFRLLCIAIRMLSKLSVEENDLVVADLLLSKFFNSFVQNSGVHSRSFNFHAMRHLVEQVRRIGPLCLFSAFAFESAHRELLTGACGTIKNPKNSVERFLKRQMTRSTSNGSAQFFSKKFSRKPQCKKFTGTPNYCFSFLPDVPSDCFFARH